MKEREISLIDLVAEILLHWRGILVSMLVGAVLFAGVSWVQSEKTASAREDMEASAPVTREVLEEQLTEEQLQRVERTLIYEKLYQDKKAYVESSVLMQMNPNRIWQGEIIFLVLSKEQTKSDAILEAYESFCAGEALLERLAEETGMDSSVVGELFTLGSFGSRVETAAQMTKEQKIVGNTVKLSVRHYDEDMCQTMLEIIVGYVGDMHDTLEQALGKHEITVVAQAANVVGDTAVLQHQTQYLDGLLATQTALLNSEEELSGLEERYYCVRLNGETESGEAAVEPEMSAASSGGISVKYIILGLVLAAFVYVFILFLQYLFNNRLRPADSLQELYKVNQLGQIPALQGKKRLFDAVDAWIMQLRERDKRRFTREEAVELAAVAVNIAAGKNALCEVSLIGCDLKGSSLELCEQLRGTLEKENLRVQILNNVLYDAAAMAQLANAEAAVLVEKAGSTLYSEIEQELELLNRQGIAVLGGILVE